VDGVPRVTAGRTFRAGEVFGERQGARGARWLSVGARLPGVARGWRLTVGVTK